jgi:cell division protein FtsB
MVVSEKKRSEKMMEKRNRFWASINIYRFAQAVQHDFTRGFTTLAVVTWTCALTEH